MREIKFRAWDGGTMILNPLNFPTLYPINELMQFTGLHDKNGTEIYEGDILSWRHIDLGEVRSEIKWGNGFWSQSPNKEGIGWGPLHYLNPEMARVEVIGNIHQHPELLK